MSRVFRPLSYFKVKTSVIRLLKNTLLNSKDNLSRFNSSEHITAFSQHKKNTLLESDRFNFIQYFYFYGSSFYSNTLINQHLDKLKINNMFLIGPFEFFKLLLNFYLNLLSSSRLFSVKRTNFLFRFTNVKFVAKKQLRQSRFRYLKLFKFGIKKFKPLLKKRVHQHRHQKYYLKVFGKRKKKKITSLKKFRKFLLLINKNYQERKKQLIIIKKRKKAAKHRLFLLLKNKKKYRKISIKKLKSLRKKQKLLSIARRKKRKSMRAQILRLYRELRERSLIFKKIFNSRVFSRKHFRLTRATVR